MENQYGEGGNLEVVMEGPFGSYGSMTKLATVGIPADSWKNAESPYFQVIEVDGISINSKVDIQMEAAQIQTLMRKGTVLTISNNDGIATVYALGAKPVEDITIQVTITEVVR